MNELNELGDRIFISPCTNFSMYPMPYTKAIHMCTRRVRHQAFRPLGGPHKASKVCRSERQFGALGHSEHRVIDLSFDVEAKFMGPLRTGLLTP